MSQMAMQRGMWDLSHMNKKKPMDPFAADILDRLEQARPVVRQTGRPLSDHRWCELANVNTGYWRDLRNGSEPGVVRLGKLSAVAGMKLSTLIAAAETPAFRLPSEERLTELMSGLLESVGLEQAAADYAKTLAQRLPEALEQVSGPVGSGLIAPVTIDDAGAQPRAKRGPVTKQ